MGVQENGEGSAKSYRRMDSDIAAGENVGVLCKEKGNDSSKKYVLACVIFASLNSFFLGYDVGVMSGAIIFIKEDLKISEVQEEVLVGILSIISLLGSLAGGKLLAGIGIGFGVMIAPVYIAEISPAVARGSFTSFPEIFINLGILIGYVSNYAFSGLPVHINWRIMLGVRILLSVFIGFTLFVIPESPRRLVMQNRIDEARLVLLKTTDHASEVEEKLAKIQVAARLSNAEKYEQKAVWFELLHPSPGVRRMLIAGCGI